MGIGDGPQVSTHSVVQVVDKHHLPLLDGEKRKQATNK